MMDRSTHRGASSAPMMRFLAHCLVWIGALPMAAPLRADPPPGKPWKLVFSDEFEGQTIDPAKWKFSSRGGWALKGIKTELTPANSFLDGQGHFVNVLSRDEAGVLRYHHGIDSKGKFDFTYGYAEARVQFSREPGWWSAFWLWGVDKGVNPFLRGQEIDIYEDFFKPKRRRDIQHAVHFDSELQVAEESDRNVGGASMLNATRMARVSKGSLRGAELAEYGGWHTVAVEWTPLEYVWYVDGKETARVDYTQVPVTTQPQYVLLSGCFRVPRETDDPKKKYYGDIREARLPDQFIVDYVRVYQEDPAARPRPMVRLERKGQGTVVPLSGAAEFAASAVAPGDRIERLCLFSNGRLRAKTAQAEEVFNMPAERLFTGENVLVAIAKTAQGAIGLSEPLTVRVGEPPEYRGTPYRGKPQVIPGKLIPGHYDEGGQGVAYHSYLKSNATAEQPYNLTFRPDEGIHAPHAQSIDATHHGLWVSYTVEVQRTGDYAVTPVICRHDSQHGSPDRRSQIFLELGDRRLAEFEFSSGLTTGKAYWDGARDLPAKTVHLDAGRQVVRVRFAPDAPFKFRGLKFAPAL